MKNQRLSEADAFALIQKRSMATRKSMVKIAEALILTEEVVKDKTA